MSAADPISSLIPIAFIDFAGISKPASLAHNLQRTIHEWQEEQIADCARF